MLSGSGSFPPPRTRASRTDPGGYESDYPVAGKVSGKPTTLRSRQRFPGSSRTPGTVLDTSIISRPGPYSWPPESHLSAGKSRTLKTLLFTLFSGHFLTGTLSTPFPSRRFLQIPGKRCLRKGPEKDPII